jgi:hypothetical protein
VTRRLPPTTERCRCVCKPTARPLGTSGRSRAADLRRTQRGPDAAHTSGATRNMPRRGELLNLILALHPKVPTLATLNAVTNQVYIRTVTPFVCSAARFRQQIVRTAFDFEHLKRIR